MTVALNGRLAESADQIEHRLRDSRHRAEGGPSLSLPAKSPQLSAMREHTEEDLKALHITPSQDQGCALKCSSLCSPEIVPVADILQLQDP